MKVKQAVVLRFKQICKERLMTPNQLANRSGITPSTVYSMLEDSRKEVGITTIKKLCDGLEITLAEFFDNGLFTQLEQEIE